MAEILGAAANSDSFEHRHQPQVTEIKRLLHVYIKGLRDNLSSDIGNIGSEPVPTSKIPKLTIVEGGFPIIPQSFVLGGCSKRQLEKLMREYLSTHYRMFTFQMACLSIIEFQ